uniref:Disease resistance protein At4g27190-like leucine-rich repeats domain-containing protein n=2 Tax=Triticum urartu TaxID=4572 RepID=A0A8R7JVK5_TRIUA
MLDTKLRELVQKQLTYVDVHSSCDAEEISIASAITVPLNRTERHVEITGTQSAIDGLWYLLSVTKSISMSCATAIDYFPYEINFHELEECELRWCHKMIGVLYYPQGLKNLRNMHVCNLKSLVWFCLEYRPCDFSRLEHLHLEDCPRLEHAVPHTATLPRLKTLDILFCYKLKTIFISNCTQENTYQLPSLQRIRLQELPLLQHFHNNDATITAPVWKELHIRGCWSLRRLPRLQGRQPETVKVNG